MTTYITDIISDRLTSPAKEENLIRDRNAAVYPETLPTSTPKFEYHHMKEIRSTTKEENEAHKTVWQIAAAIFKRKFVL